MRKIKPLGKNVLIELDKVEETTKSGIILPQGNENEKPQEGVIAAVGEHEDISSVIKVGQRIVFDKYQGNEIELEEKKFIIIKSKNLLAILE